MCNATSSTSDKINIAIDGPAGAGKSTIARKVAGILSYVYVDTGAMYRAATWYFLNDQIKPEAEEQLLEKVSDLVIEFIPGEDGQRVVVNGTEVTDEIRSLAVSSKVATYAQVEGLRTRLVSIQQQMAQRKGVVMDGRDIGTTVLPDAEVKIYMTASVEERALRRHKEMKEQGEISLEQLIKEIAERDRQDEQREISPLRQADDAVFIDTTQLTIDEVVEQIVTLCIKAERERIRNDL